MLRRLQDRIAHSPIVTWSRAAGIAAGMAVAYFLAARLGLQLLADPENVAVFWPASGLAAGVLIVRPSWRWPVSIGVIGATFTANLLVNRNVPSGLAFAFCNAGEALLMAWLINRWHGQPARLDRIVNVLAFVLAAATAAAVAAIGAAAAVRWFLNPALLLDSWRTWAVADAVGIITMAPLLMEFPAALRERPSTREIGEGVVALGALSALAVVVFSAGTPLWVSLVPLTLLFPLLLLIAARLPPVFTAAAVFIVAITFVSGLTLDTGSFGSVAIPTAQRILAAQAGLLLTALSALVLAALFSERRRAEAALDSNNKRLQLALSGAHAGVWELRVAPSSNYWSPEFRDLYGFTEDDEATEENWKNRVHPADLPRVLGNIERAIEGRLSEWWQEFRIEHPQRGERWIEDHVRVRRDESGRAIAIGGINFDITERMQADRQRRDAELALAEIEGRFRLTFENAAVGMAHVAPSGRWLRVNNRLCEITGYRQQELLELSFQDITHEDDLREAQDIFRRLLRGETRSYAHQKRCVRKDGSEIWVASTVSLASKADGSPDYVIAVIADISRQKCAEAALAASEARLRLALDAAQMGVFEMNLTAGTAAVDATEARLLGLPAGTSHIPIGLYHSRLHPEDRERKLAIIAEAEACGAPYQAEFRVRLPDGGERWIACHAQVEVGSDRGKRLVGVNFDITERKQTERHTQLLLREVSHRAKNLLAVVQAVARQTAGERDPKQFAQLFSARLSSLAASHDLLVQSDWRGVEIVRVVNSQLEPFVGLVGQRISVDGPPLILSPVAAQTIGMALHELATNASKYGALSNTAGTVQVSWTVLVRDGSSQFRMSWLESGGPPVTAPQRKGFGHKVMVDMVEQALDAEVALDHSSGGLVWQFDAPVHNVLDRRNRSVAAP